MELFKIVRTDKSCKYYSGELQWTEFICLEDRNPVIHAPSGDNKEVLTELSKAK